MGDRGEPDDASPGDPEPRRSEVESTVDLLERARAGDAQALETLFSRYVAPLRRWATGRLPRWARGLLDTEDLVQESLLQTLKRVDTFQPRREGALQAYLRQALLNRIRDEIRRAGREPAPVEFHGAEISPDASPLEEAIGRETVERYEGALRSLREEEREAIVARIEMGYSYEEVALAIGRPSAEAARSAVARALVRLVREMKRRGVDHE